MEVTLEGMQVVMVNTYEFMGERRCEYQSGGVEPCAVGKQGDTPEKSLLGSHIETAQPCQ
jgi:hypothetical protein